MRMQEDFSVQIRESVEDIDDTSWHFPADSGLRVYWSWRFV